MAKAYYDEDGVTIYHGDCIEILPELEVAALIATDPPYGTGLVYADTFIDSLAGDEYWSWFRRVVTMMRERGKTVIFTHRNHSLKYLHDWDWVGVWHKPASFGVRIGNSPILPHWEPVYFYGMHNRGLGSYSADVFSYMPVKALRGRGMPPSVMLDRREWQCAAKNGQHPTPKPIELIQHWIEIFTQPGDLVIDPFMGSGTTCMACKKLGRRAIGIEIVESFCELSANRCAQTVMFSDIQGGNILTTAEMGVLL